MDYEPYIRGLVTDAEKREAERRHRFKELRRLVEDAASDLQRRFPGTRLYLFGSLLALETFSLDSDVDLALQNLPEESYLQAFGCSKNP